MEEREYSVASDGELLRLARCIIKELRRRGWRVWTASISGDGELTAERKERLAAE